MFYKNKLLALLLAVLIAANIVSIVMYWLGRPPRPPFLEQLPTGRPSDYLIKELALDSNQQTKYLALVKIHQQQTMELRRKTEDAKDSFFNLVKQPILADSTAQRVVLQISSLTGQMDIVTLQHFRQVRAICNPAQQQKFDTLVLHQVLGMMSRQMPGAPPPPKDGRRPPPNGNRPPPPNGNRPPPPDDFGPPPDGNGPPPPKERNAPPPPPRP